LNRVSIIVKASFCRRLKAVAGRKTVEERIALIEGKIAKKKAEIEDLEALKYKLEHPVSMKIVMSRAKEAGLSPEEIAEKLGLDF